MNLNELIQKYREAKVYFIFMLLIRLSLIVSILGAVLEQSWITLFVSSLTFVLTFLPCFIQQAYKVKLPVEIQLIIILFVYGSLFLGMSQDWYVRLWWWDSLMHASSGIALGFAGFLILYTLYKGGKLQASPFLIVLFSFCFAVALGAVWEIFEFGVDHYFDRNLQRSRYSIEEQEGGLYKLECFTLDYSFENIKSHEITRVGLYDTMWDMMLNSIGALIASIYGYIYLKKGEVFLFDKLIRRYEKINPKIFNNSNKK